MQQTPKKIRGKDAETLHEILQRAGITLSDTETEVRLWRKRDCGKRLFVRLLPKPRGKEVDNQPETE